MKSGRDGFCNVVYAMHCFLKICVFIMFIILINDTRLGLFYIFYFTANAYKRLYYQTHILQHLTVQFNTTVFTHYSTFSVLSTEKWRGKAPKC